MKIKDYLNQYRQTTPHWIYKLLQEHDEDNTGKSEIVAVKPFLTAKDSYKLFAGGYGLLTYLPGFTYINILDIDIHNQPRGYISIAGSSMHYHYLKLYYELLNVPIVDVSEFVKKGKMEWFSI